MDEKRKYGWAIFYDVYDKNKSRVVGIHMTLMAGASPLCENGMKFSHFTRRNCEPEYPCEACVRMMIMRELSE